MALDIKGKITQPISEATIAGNLKDMLMNITRASDIDMRDSIAAPSLRIDGMTVADHELARPNRPTSWGD